MALSLWPGILNEEAEVSIQNLGQKGWKVPEDKNLISNLYVFDISRFSQITTDEHRSQMGSPRVAPQPLLGGEALAAGLNFDKPFDLTIKYDTQNNSAKHVYIYNHQLGKWSEILTAKINLKKKIIQIKLKIPYARIAILEEKPLFGKASWFPTKLTPRDPSGCACNKYPLGTKVKITNLKNNKSVLSAIISRGPYVPDRIIDLTGKAFSQIANIRSGLIEVKVEKQ